MSRPRSSYTLWILGLLLRALIMLLILAMCTFLVWRVFFSQRPPRAMRTLSDNAVLSAACEANGGHLSILEQEQVKYTEGENNYAYMYVDWCLFIREADQVQLLLFYNDSTLKHLRDDYGLETTPAHGDAVFRPVLTQYVDVTPEVAGERVTEARAFAPVSCETDTATLYTFCRYTFDGVDLTDDTVVVYLDMYFADDPDAYGTLRLYHEESESTVRDLTQKERKVIKQ